MSWEISILLNIIAGIILIILGWFLKEIYVWYRLRRPLSRLLGTLAKREKTVFLVIPKLYSQESMKLKRPNDVRETIQWNPNFPLFAEGDATAMMYAYNLLLKSGKKVDKLKIRSDVELLGIEKQSELVCIGAGSNSITREFLTIIDPPITFEQREVRIGEQVVQRMFGISIIDRRTNERWMSTDTHDYGLIIRLNNPFNSIAHFFILAGLGPSGTAASGYFISNQWRQIYKTLSSLNKNYEAVRQVFARIKKKYRS